MSPLLTEEELAYQLNDSGAKIMIIIDPEVDDRQVATTMERFLAVIKNDKGTVDTVDVWGRRRLAYEINHKWEGIYVGLEIATEATNLDDVERMLEALQALGVRWTRKGESLDYVVEGAGGPFPVKTAELFLGNAGTAFRPLTAALALSGGDYRLSGVARMHERPIGDLVEALRQLGADITCTLNEGFPPLHVKPARIRAGGVVQVRGDVSSQFLTALLMALLERFRVLVWAGGALLGWVAGDIMATDPFLATIFSENTRPALHDWGGPVGGLIVVGIGYFMVRRHRRLYLDEVMAGLGLVVWIVVDRFSDAVFGGATPSLGTIWAIRGALIVAMAIIYTISRKRWHVERQKA